MNNQKPWLGMQLNRKHPLAKGLVGCWIFNEKTGSTVFDLSNNNNNGTINGADWVADGLDFIAANNDYILTGNVETDYTNGITVITEINTDNLDGNHDMVSHRGGVTNGNYLLRTNGSLLTFGYYDSAWFYSASAIPLSINEDVSLACVYDGTNTVMYNNSVPELNSFAHTMYSLNQPIVIGIHGGLSVQEYDGLIKHVYIYNRTLSASEIAWLNREPYAMFQQPINPAMLYTAVSAGVPNAGAFMMMLMR